MQESEIPQPQKPPEPAPAEHRFSWQMPAAEAPAQPSPSGSQQDQGLSWQRSPQVTTDEGSVAVAPPRYDTAPVHEPQSRMVEPMPPRESGLQRRLKQMGPIGVLLATGLAKLKGLWTVFYLALKFAKLGKVAVMLGSMVVSIWAYSLIFGIPFAIGFVVLIFVHEMGHVYVAWRQGTPITAPLFVPFMGAVIFSKRGGDSAWAQAIMGIGGPVAGGLGGLVCLGIYSYTGSMFFLALASVTFFINLFNLMPIVPLDGGWIVGAVSPWLWLVGLVGLIAMTAFGNMTNPMIWVLVILSLPRVFSLFRRSSAMPAGILRPPTMPQRAIMGVCYFALAGALMLGVGFAHQTMEAWRESSQSTPAQVAER